MKICFQGTSEAVAVVPLGRVLRSHIRRFYPFLSFLNRANVEHKQMHAIAFVTSDIRSTKPHRSPGRRRPQAGHGRRERRDLTRQRW